MGSSWAWSRTGLSRPQLHGSLAPATSEMGMTPLIAGCYDNPREDGPGRAGFPGHPGVSVMGPGLPGGDSVLPTASGVPGYFQPHRSALTC